MPATNDGLTVNGLIDGLIRIRDAAGQCPVYIETGLGLVPLAAVDVDFERDPLVMRMPGDKFVPIRTVPWRVRLSNDDGTRDRANS